MYTGLISSIMAPCAQINTRQIWTMPLMLPKRIWVLPSYWMQRVWKFVLHILILSDNLYCIRLCLTEFIVSHTLYCLWCSTVLCFVNNLTQMWIVHAQMRSPSWLMCQCIINILPRWRVKKLEEGVLLRWESFKMRTVMY